MKNKSNPGWNRLRGRRGGTLAIMAACTMLACGIGVGLFAIGKLVSGNQQVQNATDAGNLNVACGSVRAVGVRLSDREQEEFGDLVDDNGLITLRTYNRVVGRAMLVAMNAQRLHTAAAITHAHEVMALAQSGDTSIGKRLRDALENTGASTSLFHAVAQKNSCRMLGTASQVSHKTAGYAVSFLNRGESSNVYLDPHYLTPQQKAILEAMGVVTLDAQGHSMVKGYHAINLGDGFVFSFVPVNPGQAPHLVSDREFERNKSQTLAEVIPANLADKLPPNTFASQGTATDGHSGYRVEQRSCAVVGVLNSIFPASLPSAYIRVTNPRGFDGNPNAPNLNNFFTGVGTTGVYLMNGAAGPIAFSSDPSMAAKWAAYNADPTKPKPPLLDDSGNPLVYDKNGQPAGPALLAQIKGQGAPGTGCNDWNVSGPNVNLDCNSFLGAFLNAYPGTPPEANGDRAQLIAVEKFQDNVIDAATGQASQGGWYTHNPYACSTVRTPRGATGLRLFNRNITYNNIGAHFTTPGTIRQLFSQVNPAAASVMPAIIGQIRQIKPEATDAEITACLDGTTLELDTVHYVYMSDDRKRKLVYSTTPPPTLKKATPADGTPQVFYSPRYQTIGLTVNTWLHRPDAVSPQIYFLGSPPPDQAGLGLDYAAFTAGSGYKGNLGDVAFGHQVDGDGDFCYVN